MTKLGTARVKRVFTHILAHINKESLYPMASSLHPTQDDAKASSTDNARYRQLTLGTSQGSSSIGEKKQKLKEIKGILLFRSYDLWPHKLTLWFIKLDIF